jgi:hypothetical protein
MLGKCRARLEGKVFQCDICKLEWHREDQTAKCPRAKSLAAGGHKDDGDKVRMEAITDAKKNDDGKSRVDLVDPEFITEIGYILRMGAEKYEEFNWIKGMAWSRPTAALFRHLGAWQRGEELDPESGFSHLAHVAANVMFLMNYQRNNIGRDDRGFKNQKSWTNHLS